MQLIEESIERDVECIAEYLIEHGVLVPPCKVGDPLWWVCDNEDCKLFDGDPGIGVYEEKRGVESIVWDGKEFGVLVDGDVIPLGSQYAMLSEADGKKWLEEHKEA